MGQTQSFTFHQTLRVGDISTAIHHVRCKMGENVVEHMHTAAERTVAVAGNTVRVEISIRSSKDTFNGQPWAAPSTAARSTVERNLLGEIISTTDTAQMSLLLQQRLARAFLVKPPKAPKAVGESWTAALDPDAPRSLPGGEFTYTVQGVEQIGSHSVVRLGFTYRERVNLHPMRVTGTKWLDIASFRTLKSEGQIEDFPVPGGATPNYIRLDVSEQDVSTMKG